MVAISKNHTSMHDNILSDVEADGSHYKLELLIRSIVILSPNFIV